MGMGDSSARTAAPAAAERVRSVLATAWSCAVTAEGGREELVGAHTVTDDGRVLLRVPDDSALLAAAICAPRGEPSAVLEFADVAPVPVRGRVRARVWLAGVCRSEEDRLALRPTRVVLRDPAGTVVVAPDDYAAARPDPLAEAEARLPGYERRVGETFKLHDELEAKVAELRALEADLAANDNRDADPDAEQAA